ncbi:MAG: hypothetical protein Q9190_004645 [Brigantiaea leucoxantha]
MSSNSSSPTPQQDNALSHIPLQQPPPGVVSNFGNATNQNSPMFTIDSALLGIMLLFFSNRIYTKAFIVRKYTWDDSVGLVIDVAILLLPIIAVMQLQLPRKQKFGVIITFMTGIL